MFWQRKPKKWNGKLRVVRRTLINGEVLFILQKRVDSEGLSWREKGKFPDLLTAENEADDLFGKMIKHEMIASG